MRILLRVLSLLVPHDARARWLEEWRAEMQHGGWRMITGALPDAWEMRRLSRVPAEAGSYRVPAKAGSYRDNLWLPPSGGRSPFHAIDQDVRYALRAFAHGKSFTLAVIGSLAIGIGATTAAFALVNATFFRPFPALAEQDELVWVTVGPRQRIFFGTSWTEYEMLRSGIPALESLSGAYDAEFAVAAGGNNAPRTIGGLVVTGNYFDVHGLRPALGRFFLPGEDAAPWAHPAVVVSYQYWQRDLSADPNVLHRTLIVNGARLPVIGVAPEGFTGLYTGADVWTTFALSDLVFRDDEGRPIQARDAKPFFLTLVGRLKPSSTIEQARAQAAALAEPLLTSRDWGGEKELFVRAEPLRIEDPVVYGRLTLSYVALPMIVLLVACVNAASLLLARATRRSHDWVLRLALGASRWRLVRYLLVESLLLALSGAALGVLLCLWAVRFMDTQVRGGVVVDTAVLLFVLVSALVTALLFGLGPALSVTRAAVRRAPEAGRFMRGPFGSRTRGALVVLQAALCLGLLATGAQFTKTLRTLTDGLPDPGHFLRVSLDLDPLRYGRADADAFYMQLLERVEALRDVRSAALADKDVLRGLVGSSPIRVQLPGAHSDPVRGVVTMYAAGEFFDVMGLPVVRGRAFSAQERQRPVRSVIVNQPFADLAFGGDAVGRVVRITAGSDASVAVDAVVVGVVAAPPVRRTDWLPTLFYPAPLTHQPALDLLLRFDGRASGVTAAVRTIVTAMDSRIPVQEIATGADLRRRRNADRYTLAQTVSVLGILALALSAAGLYGVVSYMVTQRQKEIGIRMALGASRGSVLRLVTRQAIVPVLMGCALGAAGAVIIGSLIRSRLYGVSPMDPVAFGGAALLLVLTMFAASIVPARRASHVAPITALRQE